MAEALEPAEALEVFLLIVGVFVASLIIGARAIKRHEAELSERLKNAFDRESKK